MSEESKEIKNIDEVNLLDLDLNETEIAMMGQLAEIKTKLKAMLNAEQTDCLAGKPEEVAIVFFKDSSTMMLPMPDLDVDPDTIEGLDKIKEEELKLWQPLRELPQEKQDQIDLIIRYACTGKHLHSLPKVEDIMEEVERIKSHIREQQDQANFHFEQMTSIDVAEELAVENPTD